MENHRIVPIFLLWTFSVIGANIEDIHLHLNVDELKLKFGVENYDEVPKYEIVRIKDEVLRTRNSSVEDKVITLKFKNDKNVVFHLVPNEHLIHEELKEYSHLTKCLFDGNLLYPNYGFEGSFSNCNEDGYSGIILTVGGWLKVVPFPKFLHNQLDINDTNGQLHFVFPMEQDKMKFRDILQNFDVDANLQIDENIPLSHERFKRETTDSRFMDIFVGIDGKFLEGYSLRGKILEVFSILNEAQKLFSTLTPKLFITVKKFQEFPIPTPNSTVNPFPGQIMKTYLGSFCYYQRNLVGIDTAVLISGLKLHNDDGLGNVVGMAYINGTCSKLYRCGVIERYRHRTGMILAHEVGHSIGMLHDCKKNKPCQRNCHQHGIMYPSMKFSHPVSTWSDCSLQDFQYFLNTRKCLNTYSRSSGTNIMLKGVESRFSLDAQCDWHQPGSKAITSNNPCSTLMCQVGNNIAQTARKPAISGSICSQDKNALKVCVNRNCVLWSSLFTSSSTTKIVQVATSRKPRRQGYQSIVYQLLNRILQNRGRRFRARRLWFGRKKRSLNKDTTEECSSPQFDVSPWVPCKTKGWKCRDVQCQADCGDYLAIKEDHECLGKKPESKMFSHS